MPKVSEKSTKSKSSAPTVAVKSPAVVVPKKLRESEKREEFRKYFTKLKRKLDLDKNLENVIWLHLKSIKMDTPELFDKGIQNFGYRL